MKRSRRILRNILLGLVGAISILILSLAAFAVWIFHHPHDAFEFAQRHILPNDLKITWEKIEFHGEHLGGLDFNAALDWTNLKIVKSSPALELPFDQIRVEISVFPWRRRADIRRLDIIAEQPLIYGELAPSPPQPEKSPFEYLKKVVSLLQTIHDRAPIDNLNVRLDRLTYQAFQGKPLEMSIRARKDAKQNDAEPPLNFDLAFKFGNGTTYDVRADGEINFEKIETPANFLNGHIDIDGRGEDKMSLKEKIKIAASSQGGSASIHLADTDNPLSFQNEKLKLLFRSQLDIQMGESEAALELRTSVDGIPGPLVKVNAIHLKLKTPLENGLTWSEKPSTFTVTAPIALFFVDKIRRRQMEKACNCKLPEVLATKASGRVWLARLLKDVPKNAAAETVLETAITVENVKNKIFSVDLGAELRIQKDESGYRYFPHLNCTADILSFQSVKPLLDANGVLIPAPFDILDGTLAFYAKGPVSTDKNGSRFPLGLNVDLASRTQKVKASAEASVLVDSRWTRAQIDAKAQIADLYLDLPPLDPLKGLPRITSDSRFVKTPPKKNEKSNFKLSFNFEVETAGGGGIRLASQYFQPYLPLSLKIQSTGTDSNTGFIAMAPFDVTYLRRTVHVESLRVDLDENENGVFPLKGQFNVQQTQYLITIDVAGTTKNPAISMSSDPYLPKDEIISVLLYDRTSDQLVSGDAETAGSVQAALADRAIGLFGLWAFATTPIKSFSYNPVTKVYTATVAVSNDLTAGVGTDWEAAARLELRKRISRRWSLTAAWTPATPSEEATSKLVLQWERRF